MFDPNEVAIVHCIGRVVRTFWLFSVDPKILRKLPRWGRAALTARALRRTMPLIAEMLDKKSKNTLESIEFAFIQSEDSAVEGRVAAHLLWACNRLLEKMKTGYDSYDECGDSYTMDALPIEMFSNFFETYVNQIEMIRNGNGQTDLCPRSTLGTRCTYVSTVGVAMEEFGCSNLTNTKMDAHGKTPSFHSAHR